MVLLAAAFFLPARAHATDPQPLPRLLQPEAAKAASPFLEFQAVGTGPRASSTSSAGQPRKPSFEMTISTPVTNFAHMRRGPSNTMLECIIPSELRRD